MGRLFALKGELPLCSLQEITILKGSPDFFPVKSLRR